MAVEVYICLHVAIKRGGERRERAERGKERESHTFAFAASVVLHLPPRGRVLSLRSLCTWTGL